MAVKSERRRELTRQREAKKAAMGNAGQISKYARKHAWCAAHGVFGFQVPEPKPWK
jgi:hypothetical protein